MATHTGSTNPLAEGWLQNAGEDQHGTATAGPSLDGLSWEISDRDGAWRYRKYLYGVKDEMAGDGWTYTATFANLTEEADPDWSACLWVTTGAVGYGVALGSDAGGDVLLHAYLGSDYLVTGVSAADPHVYQLVHDPATPGGVSLSIDGEALGSVASYSALVGAAAFWSSMDERTPQTSQWYSVEFETGLGGVIEPSVPELPPTLLAAGLPMVGLVLRRFRRR